MIKRILVGLCGTPYTAAAVDRAIQIAQVHEAELTGVTVVNVRALAHTPVSLLDVESSDELRRSRVRITEEQIERAVDDFNKKCELARISSKVLEEEGEPCELITSCARYHDLMVFGLQGLLEHNLVDDPHDVIVRLVGSGVRPLLAVSAEAKPVHRVLIAYSGSMESAKAMKHFVQMRLWPSAVVRIVTFEHPVEVAEQLVADAADYCRSHGFSPEEEYVPESPKHTLLPYAQQWGADLIVAGNSAKSLLLRRVMGETALNLIRCSQIPLFLSQ